MRTPEDIPFPNLEREEGGNAGSLDDRNGDVHLRVNSTEAEEEIRRLRAELDAANLRFRAELDVANSRFSKLEQNPVSRSALAPREFPLVSVENLSDSAGGSGVPLESTQAPANPSIISSDDKQQEVFTVSDEEEAQRELAPRAKQTNKEEAAAAAPTELQPAGRTPRTITANKMTPRDDTVQPSGGSAGKKRGAKPAQMPDLPTHYGGAAAVNTPGQAASRPSAGAPKKSGANPTPKTPGANTHLDVPRPAISANVQGTPSHDDHVAALIHFWPYGDAVSALAQTMSEGGKEDLNRAHDLLMRQRDSRIAAAMEREKERAPGKGSRDDEAEEEAIREGGELAVFIAGAPDAIMVVLHLVKVHKTMRSGHNAAPERTAANLIAHPMVQCFSDLKAVSNAQLRKIAMAVIHDCCECEDLRIREAARKVEEKRQAEEAEARRAREAEAERRRQRTLAERTRREEQEEAERAERRGQQRTPPLVLIDDRGQHLSEAAFKDSDAKWAKKKRAQDCHECGRGYIGGEERYLFMCDVCDKCYHKRCTLWVKVVHRDTDPRTDDYSFGCSHCAKALPPRWRLHDRTPDGRTLDDRGQDRGPQDGGQDGEGRGGRAAATPPLSSPIRLQAPPLPSRDSSILNLSLSTHQGASAGNDNRLSYKIDKYFEWKAPPSDWDILKTHPECGMSEPAYRNWKATNISRRDQAGGALGPLTNAIREDMLPSVGSVLLTNPAMKGGRTDAQVSEWLKSDPGYKWVKNVSDIDLLRTIDKHYCILDHEPFVAMKFGSPSQGYHPTTADGDTNYFASAFSAFSDRWLNALKDLRTGGWDDANRDLKQTFVNALEAQPTLHREASTYKTDCHEILIAYMRSWCILRETDVKKNAKTRAESTAARASADTAKSPGGDKQMEKYERQIKVLRTEIGALKAQGGATHYGGAAAANQPDRPTVARFPSTVDPKTQWYCNGCGKTYSKDGRPIPCERQCVYSEHAEHNKDYLKGKPWATDKSPLSWGTAEGYKARYKQEMPPTGKKFIELRAKYAAQNARKRERPTETNP
jgi:hypothetical protein